jgi:heme-degrading monooxygenase HmoA
VVFTSWNSRQDFLNWVGSDAFVKGHAQSATLPKDAYFKANVLELREVLQDSSCPDLRPEPHGGPFNMH